MPIAPLRSEYIGKGSKNKLEEEGNVGDLLSSRSFYFAERYKTIDMAVLESVDLDNIQRNVDIESLQQHLEMLTYGDMSKSLSKPLGLAPNDEAFLKIFRLSQLTIEYLLNVQDVLAEGVERSRLKMKKAQDKAEQYKFKMKEYASRIKALKGDVRAKRGAIHTYESLVAKAQRTTGTRPKASDYSEDSEMSQDDSIQYYRSKKSTHGSMTLFLTTPNGACSRYNVKVDSTAGELSARLRDGAKVRLLHKGVELAADAVLMTSGVKHGDTLVILRGTNYSQEEQTESQLLDRRIAELEASIRSEMAVQLQTQLSSLRGGSTQNTIWPTPQHGATYAGPLEDDDDDDEFNTAPIHPVANTANASASKGSTSDDACAEIRATENRLRAQMESLEQRMISLVDRVNSPHHTLSPHHTMSPHHSVILQEEPSMLSPVLSSQKSPSQATITEVVPSPHHSGPWTFRCELDEGEVELDLNEDDGLPQIREAISSELDVEMDRVNFYSLQTHALLNTIEALRSANGACVCRVLQGDLVSDAQVDAMVNLKKNLPPQAFPEPDDKELLAGLGTRQEAWRQIAKEANGAAAPLSQADVARMQIRVNAISKLLDALDKCSTGCDQDMVDRIKRDLATVCDGLPPTVRDTIQRLQQAIDARANLLTSAPPV